MKTLLWRLKEKKIFLFFNKYRSVSTLNFIYIHNISSPFSSFSPLYIHTKKKITQEINFDSERGGVSVITEKADVTTSYLLIQRARASDSGQYTCSPSNANSKSVNVHVLAGKCGSLFSYTQSYCLMSVNLISHFFLAWMIKAWGGEM